MKTGGKVAKNNLCELADDDLALVTGGAAIQDDSGSKQSWKEGDKILLEFKEQTQSVTLQREDDNSEFVHQQAEGKEETTAFSAFSAICAAGIADRKRTPGKVTS